MAYTLYLIKISSRPYNAEYNLSSITVSNLFATLGADLMWGLPNGHFCSKDGHTLRLRIFLYTASSPYQ